MEQRSIETSSRKFRNDSRLSVSEKHYSTVRKWDWLLAKLVNGESGATNGCATLEEVDYPSIFLV